MAAIKLDWNDTYDIINNNNNNNNNTIYIVPTVLFVKSVKTVN